MFWRIYKKRLPDGYYNLRFGSRWRRGARLFSVLALCSALLTGCGLLTPEPEPVRPENPTGATGRHDAEAELLFGKARVLWGRDEVCSNPEQAVAYLDSALEIEPTYAEALVRRGQALSDLGYHDDAFDDITRAIRLDPTGEAYAARGLVLFRAGNLAGARKDAEEAVRRNARLAAAWNLHGAIAYENGEVEAACADFARACEAGECAGLEAARREALCR